MLPREEVQPWHCDKLPALLLKPALAASPANVVVVSNLYMKQLSQLMS